MDYDIDEIFVDENNNIIFNGIDIISENENAAAATNYYFNNNGGSTDMTQYVSKVGDIMTGNLSVPSLTINEQTCNAFTNDYINNITSSQTKLTNMTYDESINTTTLSNQVFINNLSCNNINTNHLAQTTSNLQSQLNSIQSQINDLNAYAEITPYSSGIQSVSTWTVRNAFSNSWSSICWSPELMLFVVVSIDTTGNIIMTSPDGITWSSRTSPANNQWKSVCWSPKLMLFVAVSESGSTNRVMTSSDGITWTLRTTNMNSWSSVCWSSELGLFVAVSSSSSGTGVALKAMYSSNGINWVLSSTNNNNWESVCWSSQLGLFCAVSSTGTNRVMTSSNGIDWSEQITVANNWESICWSPELRMFCAVSSTGTSRVMTSHDGINWITYPVKTYSWSCVCWSSQLGLFVAPADSGGTTDKIMSSSDGINWTSRTSPNEAIESICWSSELGIFVSVLSSGASGNRVITSSLDGRPPTSYNVFDSTFNNIDSNGNWAIKARNLNLQNGFIQGRSDGYNFTGTSNNIYVGYCLFVDSSSITFMNTTTYITLPVSPSLPPGVYLLSGVIILNKGNATYLSNAPFTTTYISVSGIVPAAVNRTYISSSDDNLRVDLQTTYLIMTTTGTVGPRYIFEVESGASTASISYEMSIVRIA